MKKITTRLFIFFLLALESSLHAQININGHEYTVAGKMTFSCHQDEDCQNITSVYLDISADSICIYTWYQKTVDPEGEPYSNSWDYLGKQSVAIKDVYHWHNKKDKPLINETKCETGKDCSTGQKQYSVSLKCRSRKVHHHKHDDNKKNETYQTSSISVQFNDENEAEEFVGMFLKN